MTSTQHNERKRHVLSLIVQLYVQQASPVSSHLVAEQFDPPISSATVRNIMAELEMEGKITHPHTSAGRVPTDQGYRYYVDTLMLVGRLTPDERAHVDAIFARSYYAFRELLEQVSHLLARVSQHVAVGLAPDVRQGALKQFDMMPMGGNTFLGVLRTTDGFVHSHVVDLEDELQLDELGHLLRFINAELTGRDLGDLHDFFTRRLLEQHDTFFYIVRRAQELLERSLIEMAEERIYYDGLRNLFSQPEFRQDMQQTQALIRVFEEPEVLVQVMEDQLTEPGMRITIGREHLNDALTPCSMVTCSYGSGGYTLGRIGVIGPTRMPYPKAVALVEYLGQHMSQYLTHDVQG